MSEPRKRQSGAELRRAVFAVRASSFVVVRWMSSSRTNLVWCANIGAYPYEEHSIVDMTMSYRHAAAAFIALGPLFCSREVYHRLHLHDA